MRFLRVKNFEQFQHYKDRAPVWIKLYNALLDDYAFACLQDASKSHLMLIWLLASRHENSLPADPEWIGRRINATVPVDLTTLISSGFLEEYDSDSTSLATCAGSAMPEKRRVEIEKNPPNPPAGGTGVPDGTPGDAGRLSPESNGDAGRSSPENAPRTPDGFARWWSEWPRHERKVGKSKCEREWKRRSLEPIAETVIAALRHAKATAGWRKQGGAFIPMPMTWLNQAPWETAPEEMASATAEATVTGPMRFDI